MKDYIKSFSLAEKLGFIYCTIVSTITITIITCNILLAINESNKFHNAIVDFLGFEIFDTKFFLCMNSTMIMDMVFGYPPLPLFTIVSSLISLYVIVFSILGFINYNYEKQIKEFALVCTLNPIYIFALFIWLFSYLGRGLIGV